MIYAVRDGDRWFAFPGSPSDSTSSPVFARVFETREEAEAVSEIWGGEVVEVEA